MRTHYLTLALAAPIKPLLQPRTGTSRLLLKTNRTSSLSMPTI